MKHQYLQESAIETRDKEAKEQLNRDKGRLKLLAAEARRAESVNSGKSFKFLENCLTDHTKEIKKHKEDVQRDIDSNVFSHRPTLAIREVSKGVHINGHLGQNNTMEF